MLPVFAALCSVLLTSCIPASHADEAPAPRPHGAGPTIVSLNPCADAVLAEVADPAQVLALSHYSRDPRSSSMDPALARRFPVTRGTVEEVLALRPDVVIDGTFVAPATAAAYRRLGLRLETVGIAATIADSRAQVRALAALAGHPERGEALVARIDAALAAAAPPAGSAPVPAVVWQSGGIVPGQGTLVSDLLRHTGFTNFSALRGMNQADRLPLERMLADPPRVILFASASEGAQGEEDRSLSHPALAALTGTARAPFAPSLLYCGGPTIIRAAARLAEVRRALRPLAMARK
ncbi:ABC transporter substrate-binding protein [Novosphingobium sp. KCTC 2891]|uniref:ABC transporter substrate-binding protein n=1 Tax=Novosphingobium sp. KCTC 2891 TaxID=2989730 RepID=UPI002221C985|nr:ABC transporter substrate-binding protein [Novosphingobium sp. KCTC 2891]MCW1381571.1 ABC transporter substrate-binding protein [Novosphingobium sp. KCTC 2891]